MHGKESKDQPDQTEPVSSHHFSGHDKDSPGLQFGKIQQQIIDHGIGSNPVDKADAADQTDGKQQGNMT